MPLAKTTTTPARTNTSVRNYKVSYSTSSLYAKTPLVGRYLDYWVPITIPAHVTDEIFVVKRSDWVHRPEIIAFEYYGNEMLFWVFGVRNGLADPVFDIEIGTVLFFPTPSRLNDLGIGGRTSK